MKKRALCLAMTLLMCAAPVANVSAYTEQELLEYQYYTSLQLDATYDRINSLYAQKQQLESQISDTSATLVDVLVSIDMTQNDIVIKKDQIGRTSANLARAQSSKDSQYESMKQRIQYLYENGGGDAWFQMMLAAEDISDLLNRAEFTQQMYDADRKSLEKYANTINQVAQLQSRYESEQAELEEMEASLEQQSAELQVILENLQATSADCDAEISYAYQQANSLSNLLLEQQAELERLAAARIAAEQEAAAAAAAAAAEAYNTENNTDYTYDDYGNAYDEYGNFIEEASLYNQTQEVSASSGYTYDDYGNAYDEYGNFIEEASTYNQTETTTQSYDYSEASDASTSTASTASYSGSGSSVVDFATQYVGNPYVWGGTSLTNGADCSGFVQSVYSNFGVSLPRTSYEQQNAGTEVSYSDAQPGDLICYGGHVAIYMGDGKIVHASNSRDGIKISNDATYRTILSVRRLV